MSNKELLLVDGNSLFFKSFWSTWFQIKDNPNSKDRNNDGRPINALRTFSIMIINLRYKFNTSKMLVAFDERGGHTHRHKHDFYKAGRAEQPQELYDQIPLVKKFLELYGIKWYANKKYEADDIIGILAKKSINEGYKVVIVTTDKDLLQLVDKNIDVYISKTGVSIMEKHTIENFKEINDGLNPYQIIDFKAIAGDSSDNLEGIKGIGPKGAIKLLLEYKTLENVIENIDSHSKSIKEKIITSKEISFLCKNLATILIEGDLEIEFDDLNIQEPKWKELEEFFSSNGIYNVIKKLNDERKYKWR